MALKDPRPSHLLAADSNVPLDLALGREIVLDALAAIRQRIASRWVLIPPTVAGELAVTADEDLLPAKRAAAARFFEDHRAWGFRIVSYVPLGNEFINTVAGALRAKGLIDEDEINDSLVVVEAAAMNCSILLTSDEHLRSMDYEPSPSDCAASTSPRL